VDAGEETDVETETLVEEEGKIVATDSQTNKHTTNKEGTKCTNQGKISQINKANKTLTSSRNNRMSTPHIPIR
jgi:hypothetical protein